MHDTHDLSRRTFLRYTGMLTGAAAALGLAGSSMAESKAGRGDSADSHAEHTGARNKPLSRGWMFCSNELEFATLSAAAERIFPGDETGPGAVELAVPYFMDNQLAGAYGYNAREYTAGPHHFPGAPTQGYQTALLRRALFKEGLLALNSAAREHFQKIFRSWTVRSRIVSSATAKRANFPSGDSLPTISSRFCEIWCWRARMPILSTTATTIWMDGA